MPKMIKPWDLHFKYQIPSI